MKHLISFASLLGLLALLMVGCQPNQKLVERLEKIEKRLEAVESRPAAPTKAAPAEQETAYSIPVGESFVLGKKEAPVTVAVFSDYQCPFCSRVDPMFRQIVQDPELKDKVNVVFKHFPLSFHQNARPASKAALAAGEQGHDKFWAMSEKLFGNQRDLSADNYNKWAKEIGLDVKKFEKDLKDNDAKYENMIKADFELGTNTAKVRGTPTIFVAGWELKERSVEGVKKLIETKNLAQAKKMQ